TPLPTIEPPPRASASLRQSVCSALSAKAHLSACALRTTRVTTSDLPTRSKDPRSNITSCFLQRVVPCSEPQVIGEADSIISAPSPSPSVGMPKRRRTARPASLVPRSARAGAGRAEAHGRSDGQCEEDCKHHKLGRGEGRLGLGRGEGGQGRHLFEGLCHQHEQQEELGERL